MDKSEFVSFVSSTLSKSPDWFGDLVEAMQSGLTEALIHERTEKSNMAYSLAWMIEEAPKVAEQNKHDIRLGLESLVEFFDGAPIVKTFHELLEDK
jgi:hypothetical protein